MYVEETNGIEVRVEPYYDKDRSVPHLSYFFYTYTVTIKNNGDETIQLKDRHWIITDGSGEVEEVKGEGVIGETPVLRPGESYTYTSACPLQTKTGNMRGTYGILSKEQQFRVKIPLFFLRTPDTFH